MGLLPHFSKAQEGCHVSPLLFLLMIECLNILIFKSHNEGLLSGIKFSDDDIITHFLFVDDVILFGLDNIEDWKIMFYLLDLFCNAIVMEFNIKKSSYFTYNVQP